MPTFRPSRPGSRADAPDNGRLLNVDQLGLNNIFVQLVILAGLLVVLVLLIRQWRRK